MKSIIKILVSTSLMLLMAFSLQAENKCSSIGAGFKTLEPKDPQDPDGFIISAKEVPMTTPNLLEAYKNGAFPWNGDASGQVGWYRPPEHGVISLAELVVKGGIKEKKSRKVWNKAKNLGWSVTFNRAFERVIEECRVAERPKFNHVWLTEEVKATFIRLHKEGHAHSVEIWNAEGELIGGSYGIYQNGVFSGESKFNHRRVDGQLTRKGADNAGKLAVIALAKRLYATGHTYMDTQTVNDITKDEYGAFGVDAVDYLKMVKAEELRTKGGVPTSELFFKERWYIGDEPWFSSEPNN